MPSQGPNNGSAFSDDSTVGTVVWANPLNAQTSNDSYATALLDSTIISHYLKALGFGFTIPAGTITGIVVEVERKASTGTTIKDNSVKLVKGGVIGGDNKAQTVWWPTGDTYASYGSSTDLWGLSWTPDDINDANFGVVFSCKNPSPVGGITASVDHIRITVYYTTAVTYYQTLPATEVSVASLTRIIGKKLAVTEVTQASLLKTVSKTLSIQMSSIVTLTKKMFASLSVTELSIPSLVACRFYQVILSAIEISNATIVKKISKTLSTQVTSIAKLIKFRLSKRQVTPTRVLAPTRILPPERLLEPS